MVHVVMGRRCEPRATVRRPAGKGAVQRCDWTMEAERVVREFRAGAPLDMNRLRNSLCWLFEYIALTAAAGSTISRDRFHEACENLLFEQGEAAFNRLLTPVLTALLDLSPHAARGTMSHPDFARWMRALGMNPAASLRASEKARLRNPDELSLQAMLHVLRDYHLAGASTSP
ncbi:hypothetical protein [Saccharopolyspora gloriosae]|uniref:hypothetical protein n=1 Tax=Saccharopolyspora gloriosae TaxID=455344 RepID=UPI001FB82153|nr:hypothetical protein [Saccharopolyspora gloriosae]